MGGEEKPKNSSEVALSDCVHKAAVIVCLSSEGDPWEASLARLMARRPHATTGPQEYRREAAHLEDEENTDAGGHVFFSKSMLYPSAAPDP